jgi:hypothetical protein
MAYKQKTPMLHCAATIMHSESWNKMRNRTAAVSGRGDGNKVGLAHAEKMRKTPLAKKDTLKDVVGQLKKAGDKVLDKFIKGAQSTSDLIQQLSISQGKIKGEEKREAKIKGLEQTEEKRKDFIEEETEKEKSLLKLGTEFQTVYSPKVGS